MTRAPDLLRDYLATRDILCESCRYNLRGVEGIQCPECGTVIPRPPADFIARSTADPAALRLWCEDCGYTVSGVNAPRCPECGSQKLVQFSGETTPRLRRWKRLPPIALLVASAAGVLILITCIATGLARIAGPAGKGNPWQGAALSLIPLAISTAWMWWRAPLARLEPGERFALSSVASVVCLVSLLLALRTLG